METKGVLDWRLKSLTPLVWGGGGCFHTSKMVIVAAKGKALVSVTVGFTVTEARTADSAGLNASFETYR
jgi:hypothetical protein